MLLERFGEFVSVVTTEQRPPKFVVVTDKNSPLQVMEVRFNVSGKALQTASKISKRIDDFVLAQNSAA